MPSTLGDNFTVIIEGGDGGHAAAVASGFADAAEAYAAAAVETAALVSESLTIVNDARNGIMLRDEAGFAAFYWEDGELHSPDIDALKIDTAYADRISAQTDSAEVIVAKDAAGFAPMAVTKDKIAHPHISSLGRRADSALRTMRELNRDEMTSIATIAQMIHTPIYGQSLSLGAASTPPLNQYAELSWAKMFAGGLVSFKGDSDFPTHYGSLTALKEQQNDVLTGAPYGETYASGMLQMVAQLLRDEDGIDISGMGLQWLASCPGYGSQSVAQLANGGAHFTRLTRDMSYGKSLATGTYLPQAILYSQGEADIQGSTSAASYKTSLTSIQTDARAWIASNIGVDRALPILICQNASHTLYSKDTTIAEAQLDLAENTEGFYLTNPQYALIRASSTSPHIAARDSQLQGAWFGLALKRMIFDRVPWRHFRIAAETWLSDAVILPIVDCVGRPQFDTRYIADPGGYGFTLTTSSGTPISIATPAVVGNAVQIKTASGSIPSGAVLRYARGTDGSNVGIPASGSSKGCLRDSQGDDVKFKHGGDFPMHNYCPIFKRTKP